MKVHLVDSHTYSMVFGWYLCECARKLRNGGELRACVQELESKLARVEVCLAAFSLKQMKKSGRVSAAAAFAGELLGLRPIISLNDGVSKVEAKVRGDAAVIPAMIKWAKTRVDDLHTTPYLVAYTSSTQKRDELIKLCKKSLAIRRCSCSVLAAWSAQTPAPTQSPLRLRANRGVWLTMSRRCRDNAPVVEVCRLCALAAPF